jgi:ABC-type phosphate transport system substrate-binding protein
MRGLSLRFASAAAVAAASAVVCIAPNAASAACTGDNIEGQGSSLQELAQNNVWRPHFNAKCVGTEQVTGYKGTGSGAGLATWGVGKLEHNFGDSFAFVGTDQPPNPTQKAEIELFSGGGKVLSIPTLQAAVSIDINLPTGCEKAESGKGKKIVGKLALTQKQVERVFAHTLTKWSELEGGGAENKILPAGCAEGKTITRVVREDGSGTTAILKKFLFEINREPVDPETGETWNELAEKNKNLPWPEEKVDLVRAKGGKAVAKKVTETAGSIGYANLADARATHLYTPEGGAGAGTKVFWALLQNNPKSEKKFIDPATNGEENAVGNSNCGGEKYVDLSAEGKKAKFPPESTELPWNEVTAELKAKNYSLCGFTYDLSLTKFSGTESQGAAATATEVETIKNYIGYILGTGQTDLNNNDYLGLPNSGSIKKNPLLIAQVGQEKIAF